MAGWYVFDYGGCWPAQPTEDMRAMAGLTGSVEEVFVERYWRDRDALDLAVLSERERGACEHREPRRIHGPGAGNTARVERTGANLLNPFS
jgi:hypothetical protein